MELGQRISIVVHLGIFVAMVCLVILAHHFSRPVTPRGHVAAFGPVMLSLGLALMPLTQSLFLFTEQLLGLTLVANIFLWYGISFVLIIVPLTLIFLLRKR